MKSNHQLHKIGVYKWIIAIFIGIGLSANFLSNDVPILVKSITGYSFPVLNRDLYLSQKPQHGSEKIILNPLLVYHHTTLDVMNASVSPMSIGIGGVHYLGTDSYGRDVLAHLIYGCRTTLFICLLANILALLLGSSLGIGIGYFGDTRLKVGSMVRPLIWILVLIAAYMLFANPFVAAQINPVWIIIFFVVLIVLLVGYIPLGSAVKRLAIDSWVMGAVGGLQIVPSLLLVLVISGLLHPIHEIQLMLLIAVLRCPAYIRIARGETMKVRSEDYISAAQLMGQSDGKVMMKHIFPNIKDQLWVAFAFGVGSSIMLEASLAFLGLGLPPDVATWGGLISQVRGNGGSWWLVVFPGLCMAVLMWTCYRLGRGTADKVEL